MSKNQPLLLTHGSSAVTAADDTALKPHCASLPHSMANHRSQSAFGNFEPVHPRSEDLPLQDRASASSYMPCKGKDLKPARGKSRASREAYP